MKSAFVLFSSLILCAPALMAQDYACPKNVASVAQNNFSIRIAHILEQTYKSLGCGETRFITRPGKRAVIEFNNGKLDGESIRLSLIEKSYTTEFVRSENPLMHVTGFRWVSPNLDPAKNLPIGYTRGVFWQEKYAAEKYSIAFSGHAQMLTAYNNGYIDSFLAGRATVQTQIQNNQFKIAPVIKEQIVSKPLYHYLSAEYEPFMRVFSAHLRKQNPFKGVEDSLD